LEGAFSSEAALGFLSTLFAALAMVLIAAGLYGVLSYALNQRMREVGIRIAVGASSGNIAALFAREAIVIVLLGTAIGIPLALAAASLLKSQLFGVTPHDPAILFACLGCVLTTVLLAAVAPLRRAMHIAPQQALRVD
jgi:ABC-type antimicrobial peptide transport system permease subunit